MMKGIVHNCEKLCVRAKPSKDSDIITIIDAGTEILCEKSELEDWYSITQINDAPAIGCCMSQYIKVSNEHKQLDDRKEVKHGRRA